MMRPYMRHGRATAAIDVSPAFHPFSQAGEVQPRIWVYGLATEGATFYNGYLPSPGKFDVSFFDADRALSDLFQDLYALGSAHPTAPEPGTGEQS